MPMELMQNRMKKIWLPKDEEPTVPINGRRTGEGSAYQGGG